MARTVLCFTKAFEKPKALSDLVVFSDFRPFVPAEELSSYIKQCSAYAKEHQVYLLPHRFLWKDILYLCLFDPKGSIIGYQGALHRNLSSQDQLKQYDNVHVIRTPIGNLFLCVDVDIYYPEVLRLARLKGADLILSSQHIPAYDLQPKRIITGIWNAAQQQGVYVAGCCNSFSAVAAPVEVTADGSGFLVQPESTSRLFCKLYFNKLERTSMGGDLREKLNPDFCKRYASILSQD